MTYRTFAIRYFLVVALSVMLTVNYASAQEAESSDEQPFEDFDYENFDNPTVIDNEWFPLVPGMQYIFEGVTDEDGEAIPHRVITTVTDLTKVVDGIESVVIWDQDIADGELVEAEIAFFAQDNDGNVWRMGEYPEEYEDGEMVLAPGWIAGQEEAKAGIYIRAVNEVGEDSYSQGWAPAVDFTDRAQAYAVGEETCAASECYTDVLVVDEFNPQEPNAFQQKYYVSGIGVVRVGWRGEDATQEYLELIEINELDEDGLAEAREAALELEASAYENIPDSYGETEPAQKSAMEDM